MKRNDWLLLTAVAFYSFLFYRQEPGINFVIFNLVLLACLGIKNKTTALSRRWLAVALGCLVSALCVGYYGNLLSVVANIISLSILSALSINKNSSAIVSIISSASSYFAAPINMFLDLATRSEKQREEHPNYWKKIILIGIPVFLTLLFFFLYRASNPIFDKLAEKINFDFISFGWIIFTIIGVILMYGFFYQRRIEGLAKWDEQPGKLENKEYKTLKIFDKGLTLTDENFSGIVLFVLLNLLVLVVNSGDINYLLITHKLPEGVTDSQFVHQGVDALIASIIFAIAIVLFYFRGGLNFFEKSKAIKVLAGVWILQNAFMIYSTSCRNTLYISEWGLTYKRIGVYVYLLLALTGLLTTFVKIFKAKSNSFLFRVNGWLFYAFLIILSVPNWDRMLTSYNIRNNKVDYPEYMFSLSNSNITDLMPLYRSAVNNKAIVKSYSRSQFDIEKEYSTALYNFLSGHDTLDWRSWYYEDSRIYNDISSEGFIDSVTDLNFYDSKNLELSRLAIFKKLVKLNLSSNGMDSLTIPSFPDLKELNISDNHIHDISVLGQFQNLEKLNLSYTNIHSLSGIEKLKNLEDLSMYNTNITDYAPLFQLPKLYTLGINNYNGEDMSKISGLKSIKYLVISFGYLKSLKGIDQLNTLEYIDLSGNAMADYSPLYKLPNLKTLIIRNSGMDDSMFAFIQKNMPNTKLSKSYFILK